MEPLLLEVKPQQSLIIPVLSFIILSRVYLYFTNIVILFTYLFYSIQYHFTETLKKLN